MRRAQACGVWRLSHVAVFVFLGLASDGSVAFGNGAFPDTLSVVTRPGRGNELIVATNFGLAVSEDGGPNWLWVCEHDQGIGGSRYEPAAAPSARIFAQADTGLIATDDFGCTWSATALPPNTRVSDYFPDKLDPTRVLMLASVPDTNSLTKWALFESTDGGLTSGKSLYTSGSNEQLTSVERARSAPQTIYATRVNLDDISHTFIQRSDDGGRTWKSFDPGPLPEARYLKIAAVDARDPLVVYLRVERFENEELAVSRDGGATLTFPLRVPGQLTALFQLSGGDLLVGAQSGTKGAIYHSSDQGRTFTQGSQTLHPRGFAERDGKIYVAADNIADKFSVGVSTDGGQTWAAVMAFRDIRGIRTCGNLRAICQASCQAQVAASIFAEGTCNAGAQRSDAGADAAATKPAVTTTKSGGCSYSVLPGEPEGAPLRAVQVPLYWAVISRLLRRRRR